MKQRQLEIRITRKISKNFCSSEYSYGVLLDLEDGDDPVAVAEEQTEWLKQRIRDAYQGGNGGSSERSDEGAAGE